MRIKGLDLLRGIAILGVLVRHSEMQNKLMLVGGYGVDLFFVLSGFLVSGLLFREYKEKGSTSIGRFLVRRGFKIYPAFYIYLLVTVLIDTFYFHHPPPFSNILTEALFWQSYGVPLRFHTWSLSVEEHFYFILALFIFLSVKFKWLSNVKFMLTAIIGFILLIVAFRLQFCLKHYDNPQPFFGTHMRADGLFMGVLLSYVWHFIPEVILKLQKMRFTLLAIALLLISHIFYVLPESMMMVSVGYNMMHLGFALLIIFVADPLNESLSKKYKTLNYISLMVCFIGVNSYSIYLWHLVVKDFVTVQSLWVNTIVFFIGAITIGVLSSLLIENNFMKLADRYFPRKTNIIEPPLKETTVVSPLNNVG
jgi:peptidoglycan/LPS O-acetylase OafA/YrhL